MRSKLEAQLDAAPRPMDRLSPEERAYQKILKLASVKERSSNQLRARLERDGFQAEAIESALERAERNGVVDDARYADFYVRSRLCSGKGLAGITRDLERLDIDPACVPSFQEHLEDGYASEEDRAFSFLQRKPPHSKNQREGAFRKLVGQGYSTQVASSVARRWSETYDAQPSGSSVGAYFEG